MEKMLISVVIPVFNINSFLIERSLKSVTSSDSEEIEVIVVDDGSSAIYSDEYLRVCSLDCRVKYIKKENEGASIARNYGVEKSNGDYVMFLDADDVLTPNCMQEALRICKQHKADIIMGYVKKMKEEGVKYNDIVKGLKSSPAVIKVNKDKTLNHLLGFRDKYFEYGSGYISDGPVARLVNRSLLVNNHFDSELIWSEDTLWNMELFRQAKEVYLCKSTWYLYFVRENSVTQSYRANCFEEYKNVINKEYEMVKRMSNNIASKGIYYKIWHEIFFLSRTYIFNPENHCGFSDKYSVFKHAIKSKAYQDSVIKVDFSCEYSPIMRAVKEMLRIAMRIHIYPFLYFIIMIYARVKWV